jgi:hypothetical protein
MENVLNVDRMKERKRSSPGFGKQPFLFQTCGKRCFSSRDVSPLFKDTEWGRADGPTSGLSTGDSGRNVELGGAEPAY